MRSTILLPLAVAALSGAFIIPDEQVSYLQHVKHEAPRRLEDAFGDVREELEHHLETGYDVLKHVKEDLEQKYTEFAEKGYNGLDHAFSSAEEAVEQSKAKVHDTYSAAREWVNAAEKEVKDATEAHIDDLTLGHHHHKTNKTVYQLIAESKYTTILAKFINEYDDLVEALNGTSANFTVFAPTDKAFEKLPKPPHKPSKEQVKKFLSYHVSPEFYPVGRILVSRTIPTLLKSGSLGKEPLPQRLVTNIGRRGVTVNYLSRVHPANIFGTNGVIHGVDLPIFPPPTIVTIIDLLPAYLSTLELGLIKTGLLDKLNTTDHSGGTFFAPGNSAFQKLGPKINAFLFSKWGLKYLKALLKYHVVPERTLYSDAYYKASSDDAAMSAALGACTADEAASASGCKVPKGFYHVDLPTLLDADHDDHDFSLSVDIARWGRLIDIKINGFSRVSVKDAVAEDGVLHGVESVLIPPKKLDSGELLKHDGGEISVEELKDRLEPFVDHDEVFDVDDDEWFAEDEEL